MSKARMTGIVWKVEDTTGFDGLRLYRDVPASELGEYDCLVMIEAASLNFRDLMIPNASGTYPFPCKPSVIPGSDGAGTVLVAGPRVTRFDVGDRVCTTLNQGHMFGSVTPQIMQTGTGGSLDGTFRQYAVFHESGLVAMPRNLNFREASTLPCAAVTAWNCLYGLAGRPLRAGDTVLTLGTGGVSLFAVQFAVAAGATVIATTSNAEKAAKLKQLGAHHVINYRTDDKWGTTAKSISVGSDGVDFVVEVGGATTLEQSLAAVKIDGVIAIAGSIGSDVTVPQPGLLNAWFRTCVVRGIAVGSRAQFEDMNKLIESKGLRPVLDEAVFGIEQLKEAYQFMADQRHFGKVVIDNQI